MRRLVPALFVLLFVAGCDSTGETASVRVMTQNLYLGGDLFTVANETDAQQVPVRVAQLYATVEASDPAARMEAIAAEILRVNPDLVGLQEVTTYSVQSPADNLPGGAATPATDVTYDFLDLLMDALADQGGDYRIVSRSENADVEFPGTTDGQTFFDVRYQDEDVILARAGVTTGTPTETTFAQLLTVPVGGVDQTFVRSYQSVPATANGVSFTFVNTHLEVGGPAEAIQFLQGSQLRTAVRNVSGPVLVVGDINSDGEAGQQTYRTLTEGLTDAFALGSEPTCCQAADLRNPASQLQTRIDVVLYRGFESVVQAEVVLDEPGDRVGGLWPSDHAGAWAELRGSVD